MSKDTHEYTTGTVLRTGKSDRTGITYTEDALSIAIENMNLPVYGELDPPTRPDIKLDNISHRIDEVNIDNQGEVYVKMQILDTPMGMLTRELIESGGIEMFEIAPRAMGQVIEENGVKQIVPEDYNIYTFDLRPKQDD